MQQLNFRTFCYLFTLITLLSCKTNKYNSNNEYLNRSVFVPLDKDQEEHFEELRKKFNGFIMDSIRANTSDFYDIEIVSKPNKKSFTLEDKKYFSMQITNYGTKELYLPEWFRNNKDFNDVEMTIEIYKKEKKKFEKYIQKRMKTETFRQPIINPQKRIIYETSRGKHISYKDILIDIDKKIVDEGSYKVKIYIDLSNFGYFRILETEFFFEVKNKM